MGRILPYAVDGQFTNGPRIARLQKRSRETQPVRAGILYLPYSLGKDATFADVKTACFGSESVNGFE